MNTETANGTGTNYFRKSVQWLESVRQNETQVQLVLSLLVGAIVGLVVVAFILLTGRLAVRMYPPGGAGWRRILVPTVGALISGYMLYRWFPFARGSGIPQTKAALFVSDGFISMRTVLGKFGCCALSLASGIALGREGPSVQVGAGIASVIARRLGLKPAQIKSLFPAGCSAALAAAFNTPIAAVLFSLEEILGDLHAPVLGSVVLSSATAWIVLNLVLGDDSLFQVSGYQLVNQGEFLIYAALGIVGGLGSVAFVKLLLWLRERFRRMPASTVWFQPAIGGLGVGLMGLMVPEILGVGYNYVDNVLNNDVVLQSVFLLAILKIIGTPLCYSSGNAGGIFGPSLFIGAMLGASVGSVAHTFFPDFTATPGAYALVGMGTAFAGIVRTPLTSVIMIFELTRDYTIIVPLMISNLIAFVISYKLQRVPIYEALAHQDGVHLPTAESRSDHGKAQVSRAMRTKWEMFTPRTTAGQAMERALSNGHLEHWPVVEEGKLIGMIPHDALERAVAASPDLKLSEIHEFPHEDLSADEFPHVHPDHTLALALERMGSSRQNVLPVVSRADVHQLLGVVTLEDALHELGIVQKPLGDHA